jgi:hypothetical protein
MGNINIELNGYPGQVVEYMVKQGYAKTKTEALRLALFEFDQKHKLVPDEETAFELFAGKILSDVEGGKEKTKGFSLTELD